MEEVLENDQNALLADVRTIVKLVKTFAVASISGSFIAACFVVTDHFHQEDLEKRQIDLRKDMDYIKPRVERLWWKTFPDAAYRYEPLFNEFEISYYIHLKNNKHHD